MCSFSYWILEGEKKKKTKTVLEEKKHSFGIPELLSEQSCFEGLTDVLGVWDLQLVL